MYLSLQITTMHSIGFPGRRFVLARNVCEG